MADSNLFRFLPDGEAKDWLDADLTDLHGCMEAQLWKPSLILTGGLIEAVLYYHISRTPSIYNKIAKFSKMNVGLALLLDWAHKYDIIDENLFKLSDPIRNYRNLIHPKVQERLQIQATESLVQIAYNVFLEILRSVNEHYNALESEKAQSAVKLIVQQITKRAANTADFQVYVPIIEKYGISRGRLIIQRSLENGLQNVK